MTAEAGVGADPGVSGDDTGTTGCRRAVTRSRKAVPSKVNSAPRRAWAVTGSDMAESWSRVRWKPSMGMKAAMGCWSGWTEAWRALMAVVILCERVVFPARDE